MRIAILGSGGREHALSWCLSHHYPQQDIYVIPGNGGTPNSVPIAPTDFDGLAKFFEEQSINLAIVGPEVPLEAGIVDHFRNGSTLLFGPSHQAAKLETSKIFAKQFMSRHGVATPRFEVIHGVSALEAFIQNHSGHLVLKYDGLAAGKGVVVCSSPQEAHQAASQLASQFGNDLSLLVEEKAVGPELSILGITDGKTIKLFEASQDHKRLRDQDQGPNTGGMGAYAPMPFLSAALLQKIETTIIAPTLRGLKTEGIDYTGFIYFGIMLTASGPVLLEYNVRLGDPEAEVILPALKSDLVGLIMACLEGRLADQSIEHHSGYWVDVVLASAGYPEHPQTGKLMTLPPTLPPGVLIFHAATKRQDQALFTDGGRVLNIVGYGPSLEEARQKAYATCQSISFEGMYYRQDIGATPWLTNFPASQS